MTGKRVGPRFVPMTIGNIAAAQIAIAHGIHGPSLTLNTACSAGGDAIMTADHAAELRRGGCCARRWRREHPLPDRCVRSRRRPRRFRAATMIPSTPAVRLMLDRDGFVIGEGGGALLIETEEHAVKRGATIYARTCRLGEHLGRTPCHCSLPGR